MFYYAWIDCCFKSGLVAKKAGSMSKMSVFRVMQVMELKVAFENVAGMAVGLTLAPFEGQNVKGKLLRSKHLYHVKIMNTF